MHIGMTVVEAREKLRPILKSGKIEEDEALKNLADKLKPLIDEAAAKTHRLGTMFQVFNEISPEAEALINQIIRYYEEKYGG